MKVDSIFAVIIVLLELEKNVIMFVVF